MLRSVRIQNFKSFRDSTFELDPLTLVVGANGAGKSNFFDALRFLRFIGAGSSIRDAIEGHATLIPTDVTVPGIRGGKNEIVYFGSDRPEFSIEISILLDGVPLDYSITVDVERYRVIAEELRSKDHPGPYVFSTHPETNPLTQQADSPVITARFYKDTRGPNPRRDFSPHASILSQFQGRLAESRLNESFATTARDELTAISPLELRPEVLRQYSPLGLFQLGEHGENFAAVVWMLTNLSERDEEARERLDAIRKWLNELTPHPVISITTNQAPTGEQIVAVTEEAYPDRPITARSLSDGTLRFAALAFALLGSSNRQTLVIDEVESGIHAARLELLLRLFEQSTGPHTGTQVIASTHSPSFLSMASAKTLKSAIVIGWDYDLQCSNVVRIASLEGFSDALEHSPIASLQAEGWLQYAADR